MENKDITRINLSELIKKNDFTFNKRLGQNFISDKNLLQSIVSDSVISNDDIVVEIGAGAGVLTKVLCEKAKKVYAFEIDRRLKPILNQVLEDCDNYELHFEDVLKMTDKQVSDIAGTGFKVVANLPYYITTPLIMRFVESSELKVKSLTLMMQKEVAERLVAKENTSEYGVITLAIRLRGDAVIKRYVDKKVFFPVPKVDSAVVHIEMNNRYCHRNIKKDLKIIKAAFSMRRKTLLNNLNANFGYDKNQLKNILDNCGFDDKIRGEALSLEQFFALSDALS